MNPYNMKCINNQNERCQCKLCRRSRYLKSDQAQKEMSPDVIERMVARNYKKNVARKVRQDKLLKGIGG